MRRFVHGTGVGLPPQVPRIAHRSLTLPEQQ